MVVVVVKAQQQQQLLWIGRHPGMDQTELRIRSGVLDELRVHRHQGAMAFAVQTALLLVVSLSLQGREK